MNVINSVQTPNLNSSKPIGYGEKFLNATGVSYIASAPVSLYHGKYVESLKNLSEGLVRLGATVTLTATAIIAYAVTHDAVLDKAVDASLSKDDYSSALRYAHYMQHGWNEERSYGKIARHCFKLQDESSRLNCVEAVLTKVPSWYSESSVREIFRGLMNQDSPGCENKVFQAIDFMDSESDQRVALNQIALTSLLKGDAKCGFKVLSYLDQKFSKYYLHSNKEKTIQALASLCIHSSVGHACVPKILPHLEESLLNSDKSEFLKHKLANCEEKKDTSCTAYIRSIVNSKSLRQF